MIFAGMTTVDAQDKARDILTRVGLGHRLMNKPSEMSGGQQQRVAIARAFANDPAIILADEPTGNLDLQTGKLIIELLRGLNKERGVTIISATHDHKMLAVSDRIIWIRDGRVDKIQRREELTIEEGVIEGAEGHSM
jgi:putative ABC transport system ATP-binding protein